MQAAHAAIRFFRPEDTDSLADLLYEMSRLYYDDNASTREVVLRNLIDNILGPDSDVRIIVALAGARVVGMATISILYPAPKERAQLFMKQLYVVADCRSRGIGAQLVTWIAHYAVAKNCSRVDWTVDANNTRAIAFYRSLGANSVTEKLYFRLSDDELGRFANTKTRE